MEIKHRLPTNTTWPKLLQEIADDSRRNLMRKRKAQSPLPEPKEGDFDVWLNSMRLDKKTQQGLCLTRAAVVDDLAQIRKLLNEGVSARVVYGKEMYADSMPSINYDPYLGTSPLHLATSNEGRDLLANGNYSSALQLTDRYGQTPFERCICDSDLDGVKYWLEKGAIINSEKNPLGVFKLALHNEVIFNYLLFRGVRIRTLPDLEDLEKTANEQNARSGIIAIIKKLQQDLRFLLGYDLLPPKPQTAREADSKKGELIPQARRSQEARSSILFAKTTNSPGLTNFFDIQSKQTNQSTKEIDDPECSVTPSAINLTSSS